MALAMESQRKKRKIINNNDDDNNDDVKMERFFALIRNVKDIRDRLLGSQASRDRQMMMTTTTTTTTTTIKEKDKTDAQIWQPSFRPEDFGEVGIIKNNGNNQADKKPNEEDDEDEDEDEDERAIDDNKEGCNNKSKNGRIALDLNLSL